MRCPRRIKERRLNDQSVRPIGWLPGPLLLATPMDLFESTTQMHRCRAAHLTGFPGHWRVERIVHFERAQAIFVSLKLRTIPTGNRVASSRKI